jgi:hypothetical protein
MVTISKTNIANLALSNIHARSTIQSLTENSTEARLAKLWYDHARRQALAEFDWGFARIRQALAEHSVAAPTNEWNYRYQYPALCLAPRYIENPAGLDADSPPMSTVNAGDGTISIVTDAEDAVLLFTSDVETVALFTPHFVTTLSFLLAFYIAGPITSKDKIKQNMIGAYFANVNVAAAHDANQSVPRAPREAEIIRGR